jgi:hypothetical protein
VNLKLGFIGYPCGFWFLIAILCQVFFFSILWCCHTRHNPQGGLAMFGYRPTIWKKRVIKILIYPSYLLEQCVETWCFLWFLFLKMGVFLGGKKWQIFNRLIFFEKKNRDKKKHWNYLSLTTCANQELWVILNWATTWVLGFRVYLGNKK